MHADRVLGVSSRSSSCSGGSPRQQNSPQVPPRFTTRPPHLFWAGPKKGPQENRSARKVTGGGLVSPTRQFLEACRHKSTRSADMEKISAFWGFICSKNTGFLQENILVIFSLLICVFASVAPHVCLPCLPVCKESCTLLLPSPSIFNFFFFCRALQL